MNRTTAPGSLDGAYVDDDPVNEIQGTLLIAEDRNAIQEEILGVIEGAGLTPSAANLGQLLAALRKGEGSTVDADKLDGQHGAYYRDAGNLNAGTIPIGRLSASDLLTLVKTVDGEGSGLDADLFRGMTPAQFIATYVQPVGSYYTQYPDASSNTDSAEFPTAQRPATLFGGTWAEQWATESVYFRTRGTLADNGRVNGKQEDALQGHWHRGSGQASNTNTGMAGWVGNSGSAVTNDLRVQEAISDGTNGTPRTAAETRTVNRRIKVWKRTA